MARRMTNAVGVSGKRGAFSAGPTDRLTVRIPKALNRKLLKFAEEHDISVNYAIVRMIEDRVLIPLAYPTLKA